MTRRRGGGPLRSIQSLYDAGALAGLDDADLLARFLDGGDGAEAAFEAVVARHGAMVLHVCRAAAGPDAEDAFQATFLVLACRASSVRRRGSLGPWLFGVARRIATRARLDAARRRARERRVAEGSTAAIDPPGPDDDLAILMDELARLPARDRDPIVLCHLQGLTYREAAERLRCPLGTLSIRLKRAKERLRLRLERRGVSDPARSIAPPPPPLVPLALSTATARLATLAASALGAGVPTSVLTLTRGALWNMRIARTLVVSTAFLGLAVGLWAWRATAGDDPAPALAAQAGRARPASYQFIGKVVDEETGEPVAGATIQILSREPGEAKSVVRTARSEPDGAFSMDLPPGHGAWTSLIPPPGYWDPKPSLPGLADFALSDAAPTFRQDYTVRRGAPWEFRATTTDQGPADAKWAVSAEFDPRAVSSYAEADAAGRMRMGLPRTKGEARGEAGRLKSDALRAPFSIRWDDQFQPEAVRSVTRLDGNVARFWLADLAGRTAIFEDVSGGRFEPRLDDGRLVIHLTSPATPPGALPEVSGRVVDVAGKPVAEAKVEVAYVVGTTTMMADNERCTTATDAQGCFRLADVPPTVWGSSPDAIRLIVTKDGHAGSTRTRSRSGAIRPRRSRRSCCPPGARRGVESSTPKGARSRGPRSSPKGRSPSAPAGPGRAPTAASRSRDCRKGRSSSTSALAPWQRKANAP